MKSKNVIVLLLSLTLSMVINAMPAVDNDIGLKVRSPEVNFVPAPDSNVYATVGIEPLTMTEPVFVRTSVTAGTVGIISVSNTKVTIVPKCRDVDLRSPQNIYENIISASIPARNRTAHLHDDGGGGHGEPV
jgi:hypothetical protein